MASAYIGSAQNDEIRKTPPQPWLDWNDPPSIAEVDQTSLRAEMAKEVREVQEQVANSHSASRTGRKAGNLPITLKSPTNFVDLLRGFPPRIIPEHIGGKSAQLLRFIAHRVVLNVVEPRFMNTLVTPGMIDKDSIDISILVRKLPILLNIILRQYTWNELGESLVAEAPKRRRGRTSCESPNTPQMSWIDVKNAIFRLLSTSDPEYADIRKRIVGAGNSSTLYVLSAVSLWLAGNMSASTSITTPLVGVILYGVADSPEGYQILLDP